MARYKTIAKKYVALPSSGRAQTLIATGANVSRKAINNLVHEYRGLAGKGYQHKPLTRHDTKRMQRRHAKYYIEGDTVRVTCNNAELDLANGDRYEVLRVSKTSVTIGLDGRAITLPADQPLHIDHAYATTAHSAQGLTCDRVFYNAESILGTMAQDTYYVSISRERYDVVAFADDAQKLPDVVARVPYKGLAHDFIPVDSQVEGPDFNVLTWQRKVPSLEITPIVQRWFSSRSATRRRLCDELLQGH